MFPQILVEGLLDIRILIGGCLLSDFGMPFHAVLNFRVIDKDLMLFFVCLSWGVCAFALTNFNICSLCCLFLPVP